MNRITSMSTYKPWRALRAGDIIDVIAPASACLTTEAPLSKIHDLLVSWGLIPRIPENLLGSDLLCANTDTKRLEFLKNALLNTDSAAIWCLRGGYGSGRLIPKLANIELKNSPPPKLFIGMSDITALHLFLQQHFGWPTVHGPSVRQVADNDVDEENIQELKKIMFGQQKVLQYDKLTLLNDPSVKNKILRSMITGGNLCLVENSIGTLWQVNARNKILFLEEINERAYRIDRMLQHLEQAGIFQDVSAVLFGDFTGGKEPDGSSLIEAVLQRFAESCDFPVLHCPGIGHEKFNRPLPLGTKAELALADKSVLAVETGFSHG